jgi:hypothetical protein
MNKNDYKEYKDATYSVRQKIPYKETPDALMTFEKKTGCLWQSINVGFGIFFMPCPAQGKA